MKRKTAIIALAQIKYFQDSTQHNLKKIKKFISLAKKKKADIICFPESCLHKSSLDLNHKIIKQIQNECKKNSIWCIITDDIRIKNKTYNLSLLINRKGEIKGDYRKIHLYGDKKIVAGKKTMVFKTDFAKIGIAICWDLAFPELFKEMKKAGAEIVFCPAQWWYDSIAKETKHPQREIKILESLILARAYENVFFVGLCNPVLNSKFQISYSAIASPIKILNQKIGGEGLIISKLNLNQIKKIEKIYND